MSYQIGETAGDHLGTAVVAVLAHLGNEDSGSATFTFGESLDFLGHRFDVRRVAVLGSESR
jgi:hypothetical protein